MSVPFSNTKLRVPRGFQNLLEGLAREVLRSQPADIYVFGASYFEALLKKREDSGIDPVEIGAKLEDRFYNNKAFTEPEVDASNPQQQDAARVIQTKFRQHAAKQEVDALREDKAATTIQAGFRGHLDRVKVSNLRGNGDKETAPQDSEEIDFAQMQAGFKARKETQEAKLAPSESEEVVDIDLNDPGVQDAAVLIQAGFRSMMARRRPPPQKTTIAAQEEIMSNEEVAVAASSAVIDDGAPLAEADDNQAEERTASPSVEEVNTDQQPTEDAADLVMLDEDEAPPTESADEE